MASISENQEQEYCHIENQVAGENMFLAMVCLSICLHCDHETLLQICHSISDSKHKAIKLQYHTDSHLASVNAIHKPKRQHAKTLPKRMHSPSV